MNTMVRRPNESQNAQRHRQTERRTDGHTIDMMMTIADHTVQSAKNVGLDYYL